MVGGFQELLADPRSKDVTRQALAYLAELFAAPDSLGSAMAGRVEDGVGDPDTVAVSVAVLVGDLRAALAAAEA
jgi:hypothetical protein